MRPSKIHVVALTLACLMASGAIHAQFGKLKSLADKVTGAQPPKAADVAKGPYGEVKATLAPGVKKSVSVKRQSSGTPVATSSAASGGGSANVAATSGSPQTVTIKVSHIDATQFDAVRGYSPCNKLSNFQILSATQMKVTIDLTANKSSGTCALYFRTGGETVFTGNVTIKGK